LNQTQLKLRRVNPIRATVWTADNQKACGRRGQPQQLIVPKVSVPVSFQDTSFRFPSCLA
jgi:hypothetical protein